MENKPTPLTSWNEPTKPLEPIPSSKDEVTSFLTHALNSEITETISYLPLMTILPTKEKTSGLPEAHTQQVHSNWKGNLTLVPGYRFLC